MCGKSFNKTKDVTIGIHRFAVGVKMWDESHMDSVDDKVL